MTSRIPEAISCDIDAETTLTELVAVCIRDHAEMPRAPWGPTVRDAAARANEARGYEWVTADQLLAVVAD
jgi:hypothetical protein